MRHGKFVLNAGRAFVVAMLVAGVAMFGTTNSTDAVTKYARVTFHVAECPENTADVFRSCHENRVAGVEIVGHSPTGWGKSKLTDDDGVVFFGPRAGHNLFGVARRSAYEGTYVYCSVQNRGHLVLIDRPDEGLFSIDT